MFWGGLAEEEGGRGTESWAAASEAAAEAEKRRRNGLRGLFGLKNWRVVVAARAASHGDSGSRNGITAILLL